MLTLLLLACPPTPKESTPSTDDSTVDTFIDPTPPTAPVVEIAPDPASPEDDLSVVIVTPSEPGLNGGEVTYRYAWTRNGEMTSETGDTIDASLTENGDTWAVTVTPQDNNFEGEPGTDSILVGNPAPSTPVIHIDPASPNPGDMLVMTVDTVALDPLGEPLTESIYWFEDGEERVDLAGFSSIPGEEVDGGEVWRVVYSVSDGVNPPVSAEDEVTASNQAPVIDQVRISPVEPKDGDALTCMARSSDPDRDLTSTTYHWFKDGVEVPELLDEPTVDASLTAAEEEWYCAVTVSDGHAEASGQSDAVVIQGSTIVFYEHDLTMTLAPDGNGGWASMTGDYELYLYTTGSYGYLDCRVLWDLVGTAQNCRNCDYSFSATATVDLAASTLINGCSTLAVDSSSTINMTNGNGYMNLADPYFVIYQGYNSQTIYPYFNFGDNTASYSNYYNYVESRYYAYTSTTDAYGNLQITTYAHLYAYAP